MGILDDIKNFGLSYATLKMAKEGKKLKAKDDDNRGKDDLAGSALVTGAMLVDELSDGETNKHEAVASALENLAAQIRIEGESKSKK